MKKKIAKIIYILSFAPALILILVGIYHSIFGYDVYTMIKHIYIRTIYGFEAFMQIIIWYGLSLIFIPVLPCCLIYQIVYICITLGRKKNSNNI